MFSFTMLPTIALAGLMASSAVASPTPSPVTPSKCVTYKSGTLRTAELENANGQFNGQFKPFAFNYRGELSFYHQTQHPTIKAEFQTCTPNYAGDDNKYMDKVGRIYLPATKQCLGVNNPYNGYKGPYQVRAFECPNSSAGEMATDKSIPFNFIDSRGYITWVGASTQNGTVLQGDCPGGDFGFSADNTRTPITDKAGEYRVNLVCSRTNPTSQFWIN